LLECLVVLAPLAATDRPPCSNASIFPPCQRERSANKYATANAIAKPEHAIGKPETV
jgi:hypothetical protein